MTVNQHCGADVDLELQILEEIDTLKTKRIKMKTQYVQSTPKSEKQK
jgi:hypothetical protein